MLTHGIVAFKRMAFIPCPTALEQQITPKHQLEEYVSLLTALQSHNEIFAPLALETDLAWSRVKDVCADFPAAAALRFSSWEQLAWDSAKDYDEAYPGFMKHFEDQINDGNFDYRSRMET